MILRNNTIHAEPDIELVTQRSKVQSLPPATNKINARRLDSPRFAYYIRPTVRFSSVTQYASFLLAVATSEWRSRVSEVRPSLAKGLLQAAIKNGHGGSWSENQSRFDQVNAMTPESVFRCNRVRIKMSHRFPLRSYSSVRLRSSLAVSGVSISGRKRQRQFPESVAG